MSSPVEESCVSPRSRLVGFAGDILRHAQAVPIHSGSEGDSTSRPLVPCAPLRLLEFPQRSHSEHRPNCGWKTGQAYANGPRRWAFPTSTSGASSASSSPTLWQLDETSASR